MDRKVIEERQYLAKYLTGKLTPPEAKFFEGVVRQNPELLDELGLPDALRRATQLLDDSGEGWAEPAPLKVWQQPRVALGAAGGVALLLAFTLWQGINLARVEKQRDGLQATVNEGLLLPPSATERYQLQPARPGVQPPRFTVGLGTPHLIELYLAVGYAPAPYYRLRLERADGTFMWSATNLVRDSNGELRATLNSSMLVSGEYQLEVEAVNLRGDGSVVGRLRIAAQ